MHKEILRDAKAKLAFRKATRIGYESPAEMGWDDLHETRSSIQKGLDDLLLKAQSDGREISESEQLAFDYGCATLDEIKEEFQLRDKCNTKNPVDPTKPINEPQMPFITGSQKYEVKMQKPGVQLRYRDLFPQPTGDGGFRSFGEFVNVLCSGRMEERLLRMQAGTGVLGGFAVPEPTSEQIIDAVIENSVVLGRARLFPLNEGGSLNIPLWDSSDHTVGPAQIVASWVGEAVAATETDARLVRVTISSNKLIAYISASNELLEDVGLMEREIGRKMTEAIAFSLDEALLTGTGIAKPKGIINCSGVVTYNRAVASQIAFADVVGMYARLYPGCIGPNTVWIANPSILPQLYNIHDAGNHNLLLLNAAPAGPQSLFGIPLVISEKISPLGTKGDLVLCDLAQYAVAFRRVITLEKSTAPHWLSDMLSFRCSVRIGSSPLWTTTIKPASGGAELGWAVVLDVP